VFNSPDELLSSLEGIRDGLEKSTLIDVFQVGCGGFESALIRKGNTSVGLKQASDWIGFAW
jgi:hypothetical protein